MEFDEMAYPDDFEIAGQTLKGSRNRKTGNVTVPYTDSPVVRVGDTITQKNGPNLFKLRVLDVDYQQHSSLEIGTRHPHILALTVQNMATEAVVPKTSSAVTIGSLSAHQVQIGDHNTQTVHISLVQVVREVAESGDAEAKGLLRRLLENSTVATVVGAGASALLSML